MGKDFSVEMTATAIKDLKKIREDMQDWIVEEMMALADNPRPRGVKKLTIRNGVVHRIRVGNYRIVYTIDSRKLLVQVVMIGDRKSIYQRLK